MSTRFFILGAVVIAAIAMAACGASDTETATTSTATSSPSTAAPPTSTTSTAAVTTTIGEPIAINDDVWSIDFSAFDPRFTFAEAQSGDWYEVVIDDDDLFLGLYLRPGPDGWDGGTGEFEVSCDGGPGNLCVLFSPTDQPHPLRRYADNGTIDLDAGVTGRIEVSQLDQNGYDLTLDVLFSDGTRIEGLQASGSQAPVLRPQADVYLEGGVWQIDPSDIEFRYRRTDTIGINCCHVENVNLAEDSMFFRLRMVRVGTNNPLEEGYKGGTGTFELDCKPASETGLCLYFSPPGFDALNPEFDATGTVDIRQLDDAGYDVVLDVEFSDGTRIEDLRLQGEASS